MVAAVQIQAHRVASVKSEFFRYGTEVYSQGKPEKYLPESRKHEGMITLVNKPYSKGEDDVPL